MEAFTDNLAGNLLALRVHDLADTLDDVIHVFLGFFIADFEA